MASHHRVSACFCLSKGRNDASTAAAAMTTLASDAALRAELQGMTPSQLRKRAAASGATDAQIEAAEDAAVPQDAMIDLIAVAERSTDVALRAELEQLPPSQLRKRAASVGVADAQIEAAEDAAAPRDAMIELIVAAESGADVALRAELEQLPPSQLRKRAVSVGVADAQIEAAEDATAPKALMIELIVGAGGGAQTKDEKGTGDDTEVVAAGDPQLRPHFGIGSNQVPPPQLTGRRAIIPKGKHAMLSYQWDHQTTVSKAHKALRAHGVKCWMDIDGGMSRDVYDSMAEGVQGAAVVICFMSRKYQLSDNCKLELKFARQTGIPIVPVMLEERHATGWKPSDWLGVITAGLLWTPLYADSDFDQSIKGLVSQVQANIEPTVTAEGTLSPGDEDLKEEEEEEQEESRDDLFSLDEMREELERLRADSRKSAAHLQMAPGEQCTLPAIVPEMRDGLVVSDSMHKLVDTVMSVTSKHRCGFWGSGGIGKTTTSAWLCRQERIRRHFDMIVWVTLSQTPNIVACQRQLFAQLTGQELLPELCEEDRRREIQEAFVGKHCLLVLDDAWDSLDLSHFALIDETTHSRVLISSRVISTLESCDVVDIGLPTEEDAIQMVMAAAGMARGVAVPDEARKVARLCKLLPLTLGIAGRLVKGLDLQHDWSEVVAMITEELTIDGEARSAEDGVIATSLRAIEGRDADSARALFKAFRLVPEDVKIPLEALAWVYEASNGAEEANVESASTMPTMLQLRKWTKLLIDRCLILGPIDQPSLHDIVGDYTQSMTTQEVTRIAHRRLINIFRERRPDVHGWDELETDGRLSQYVIKRCEYHIRASWMLDWRADTEAISWLEDFKVSQDAIPLAAAHFLGTDRTTELAREAESEGNWWSASLRWSATALDNRLSSGMQECQPLFKACATSLENVHPTTAESVDAKQRLELTTIILVLHSWDVDALSTYVPRLNALRDSNAAKYSADTLATIFLMSEYSGEFWGVKRPGAGTAEELRFGKMTWQYMQYYIVAAREEVPGSRKRNKLLALAFAMNVGVAFLDMMVEAYEPSADAVWDAGFGVGGSLLNEASMGYDFETHHKILLSTQSWDGCLRPSHVLPLFLRWGDLENANANADRALHYYKKFSNQPSRDGNTQQFALLEWPYMLYLLGRSDDALEFMRQNKVDWCNAAETVQTLCGRSFTGVIAGSGPTQGGVFIDTTDWVLTLKSIWMLVATHEESAEQFLAELPPPDELAMLGVWRDQDGNERFHPAHMLNLTNLVWPALALEKLGVGEMALGSQLCEMALAYATKALDVDQTTGGGGGAHLRTLAYCCCGRILARQGKVVEAQAAFEAAEALAAARGYWMLETLAVRDLIEHVLEPAGELGAGQVKLAPLAARLTGPRESLATLLGEQYV